MDTSPQPPATWHGWIPAGLFTGLGLLFGLLFVPRFLAMQARAKGAELPSNVDGIRTAELSYDAAYGHFVPCAWPPRPESADGARAPEEEDCAARLGAPLRATSGCSYRVVLVGVDDFEVLAECEDGRRPYRASKLQNAYPTP